MSLSREAILKADDRKTVTVACPEWGGDVRVRAMSGAERDAFEESLIKQNGKHRRVDVANIRAKFVIWVVVDETGERLFEDGDEEMLGQKSAAALDRVFDVGRRMSGLSEKDVEELAEGFGSAQSERSTSA